MKQFFNDIHFLWRSKFVFRIAGTYLVLFFLLVLLLPWLPLSYSPTDLHLDNVYQPPFALETKGTSAAVHWFGTDALGRDVLAFTLHGARTATLISVPVMLLSSVIGLLLGISAGFFGNSGLKMSRSRLYMAVCSTSVFLYLGLYVPLQLLDINANASTVIMSLLLFFLLLLFLRFVGSRFLEKIPFFRILIAIPIDRVVLGLIETLTSIPRLIFILVLASFMPPSIMLLSGILILTYWTGTARLARAEILKIKQLSYFEAATSLGASNIRLLLHHAFPNLLSPIVVTFIFGLSGLLTFESTLSFLGIGVPANLVSWGKMIAGIKQNSAAWWLVAFPGGFLVLTVLALQLCSYFYLEMFRNRKA